MIRTGVLLALVAAAMAGCGRGKPDQPGATPSPQATATPLVNGGWAALFGNPARTVELLAASGFRAGPWALAGDGYRSDAVPTPMSDPSGKAVDTANLRLAGSKAAIDTVRLSLDLVNPAADADALRQFGQFAGTLLAQYGLPGADAVLPAVAAEREAAGTVTGAAWRTTRETIPGGRRLIVTFSRPGARTGPAEPRNT